MNMERYHRQAILKGFGPEGQQKLRSAKVLVVGAGGLGLPVLSYLNAMGVGTLGIVDKDTVSLSNLHRQVLFTEKMVGLPKVLAAKNQLGAQNSQTQINLYQTYLSISNALDIMGSYDVIVDATDNFPTRYLINDACVLLDKPFVYGALHGFEGQISVFNYNEGPTYRCLFPKMPSADAIPNCNEHGVLGILPGIVGNLQALEAIKVITGIGEVLSGVLLLFDGLSQRSQRMKFSLRPENKKIKCLAPDYDFVCDVPMESIQADRFRPLLAEGRIRILDVRALEAYQKKHLEGAIHIPINELEARFEELRSEPKVYVICQSGITSVKAIRMLQGLLPQQEFVNVAGGMNKIDAYAATY